MRGFHPDQPLVTPSLAYPHAQRLAHAEQHLLAMHALRELETTSCWQICRTYGVPEYLGDLKAMKSKFRNELSFNGGEK